MYNLVVGYGADSLIDGSRMLEYTDEAIKAYVAPDGTVDPSRLLSLPVLLMPEVGQDSPQVAQVGSVGHLTPAPRGDLRFHFSPTPGIAPVALDVVQATAGSLGITRSFEFHRTHWAVKDVDLHAVLSASASTAPTPSVFKLPRDLAREADLVAVMMPFDQRFADVYEVLEQAVADAGMRCQRVDQIWDNHAIMDDVASLIWRARVVIADLSGRNANVFYETGIAHTLDRDVISIAQSEVDVPFDLRHLRYVSYLHNSEGLQSLKRQVASRLQTLTASQR